MERVRFKLRQGSYVFAPAFSPERLAVVSDALRAAGVKSVGPGAWMFTEAADPTVEAIQRLLDRLENDEVLYIVGDKDQCLEFYALCEPRTDEGIRVV